MLYFLIILSVLIFLALLYLIVLVRPDSKVIPGKTMSFEYAHRGLHTDGIPENSLAAFRSALEQGMGIEFDIQLSKDGKVMVFHDYNLKRMTGIDKKLCELDCAELKKLKLLNTNETIPTLEEVLELVKDNIPMLIELKGDTLRTKLCYKAAELLDGTIHDFCIESFNPIFLMKIKKLLPDCPRGQLYTNVCRDKKKYTPLNILLSIMAFNFLSRPHFIAYNKKDRDSFPVKLTTKFYYAYKFIWTINSSDELITARKKGEMAIFENIF